MQMAITFLAVVGGLVFSLAIAVLAEEIISDRCSASSLLPPNWRPKNW